MGMQGVAALVAGAGDIWPVAALVSGAGSVRSVAALLAGPTRL